MNLSAPPLAYDCRFIWRKSLPVSSEGSTSGKPLRKITSHLALAYGDTGEKGDTFAAMLLSNDVRTARVTGICESLNCTHWDTYPDLYFC